MFGFFPPSSSETFLNNGAHASATLRPVTVPPVKEMVLILGCAVIAAPDQTSAPQSPRTTTLTPRTPPALPRNRRSGTGDGRRGQPRRVHASHLPTGIIQ